MQVEINEEHRLKVSKIKERKKLRTGDVKEYIRLRGYIDLPTSYEDRELYVIPKELINTLNELIERFEPSFTIDLSTYPKIRELISKLFKYEPRHYDVKFVECLVGDEDDEVKKIEESIDGLDDELMDFLDELSTMIEKMTGLQPTDFRYDWVNRLEVITEEDVSLYIEVYPRENYVKVEITKIEF
mgnify:FL=1